MALEGTPRQAKFAARFIAYSKHKEACAELIEASIVLQHCLSRSLRQSILENLSDRSEEKLLSYMRALSELALSAPVAFEEKSAEIIRFVLQDVMFKMSPSFKVRGPSEYLWGRD
jgi:sister-chromatid-cohesion protein PDS5